MGWIVLFGAIVSLILVWVDRRERRRAPNLDPSCGQCGYCVRGIPTFICPECGSDVRDVGIIVPSRLRKFLVRPFTRVLMFTTLVPLPMLVLLDTIGPSYVPQRMVIQSYPFIVCNADYLKVTIRMVLEADQFTFGANRSPDFTSLTMSLPGSQRPLAIDLETKGYAFTSADGKESRSANGFGPATIGQWLASHGFDPAAEPRILDRARDFATIADAVVKNDVTVLSTYAPMPSPSSFGTRRSGVYQFPPLVTVSQGGRTARPRWSMPTTLALYAPPLLVWVIGTGVILRRKQAPAAPVPAAA